MIFKKKSTQFVWLSALFCALFVFAYMAEAGTATVYRWRTDDGTIGYSDSLKRVPQAYRSQVKTKTVGSLYGYKKLTLEDSATRRKHSKAVAERIEYLRKTNEALDHVLLTLNNPRGLSILSGTTGGAGPLNGVVLPTDGSFDDETIHANEIQMRDPRTGTTRTSTVYRQGDRIIFVRTPRSARQSLGGMPVEPEDFE